MSLVLRFGNQHASTIDEHTNIIDEKGHCWWGWWAKAYEPDPSDDELNAIRAELSANSTMFVGLLDRRTPRYFQAKCSNVEFGSRANMIPSPDVDYTPRYYASDKYRIWLKFDEITQINESGFSSKFGVPGGNTTWFWGRQSQQGIYHDVVDCPGSSVLHISDLHFGQDFEYNEDKTNPGNPQLHAILLKFLQSKSNPFQDIGAVIVTGDIITQAKNYFHEFESFIDQLTEPLGLSRKQVLIVPGNHDLWLEESESVKSAYAKDYAHETDFRSFLDRFYGQKDYEIERLTTLKTSNSLSLNILRLNSARLRSYETMEYGYVGLHRIEKYRDLLERDNTNEIGLAMLHHHLLPVSPKENIDPKRPVSVTVDAGALLEFFSKSGVKAVFHGHQHSRFVGNGARMDLTGSSDENEHLKPLWVVASGSTGVKSPRLPKWGLMNSFNVYRFGEDGINACFVEFNSARAAHIARKIFLPFN